jgi:hypothetical protein
MECGIKKKNRVMTIMYKGPDYSYCVSLTKWLSIKYNMSYKDFRKLNIGMREYLKSEYLTDIKK